MSGWCCETFCNAIWPIIFGLFLFEAVGEKSTPSYDCYANNDDNYPIAGIMDIKDDYWVNVSFRFRVILYFGFITSLVATFILMPLKLYFAREYFM